MGSKERLVIKNTGVLYVRLLFTMAISLYTSRIVLNVLGVKDFGIFTVVAGFISLFSILSDSLANSISRFISVALGKESIEYQKKTFSSSVNVQIILALILFVLLEIIGLWFINNKLNIPIERRPVLGVIFQMAIINFLIVEIKIPFISVVIAHEHASFFAKISVSEALLKLLIVYLIRITTYDHLVAYVLFLVFVTVLITIWTIVYSIRSFKECRYKFEIDKSLIKQMLSFASWNVVGQGSRILNTQGVSIVINLFFGVAINAARGIASQIDGATQQFTHNIMIAVNPQIMKSYASGDFFYLKKLICQGSKYAGFVSLFFLIPLLVETDLVLDLWLGVVPDYTSIFTRLSLIASLVLVMSSTLNLLMQASGRIKYFQISYGLFMSANVPLSYYALKYGCSPISVYMINILMNLILIYVHLLFVKSVINFSGIYYLKEVLLKVSIIFFLSIISPLFIILFFEQSILRLILVVMASTLSIAVFAYMLGLDSSERLFLLKFIRKHISFLKV